MLAGYALLLVVCYRLAIRKTVDEYFLYCKKSANAQQATTNEGNYLLLKKKKEQLQAIERKYLTDTAMMDRKILVTLDNYCQELQLNLREYKPSAPGTEGKVWTRSITLEGNFANITRLIYQFEQKEQLCRIASVHYKSYQDNANKKNKLSCIIYLQNLYNGQ